MENCKGQELTEAFKKGLPDKYQKQINPHSCRVYKTNWDGRVVENVICAIAKENPNAETVKIKIFSSTLFRHCFVDTMKQAEKILDATPEDMKSNFINLIIF